MDALFGPITQAFATDVQVFVEDMQLDKHWPTAPKPEGGVAFLKKMFLNQEPTLEGFVASGRVRVVSLSSSPAKVTGDTVSFFDMTPPPEFVFPSAGSGGQGAESGSTAESAGPGSVLEQAGLAALSPFTAGTVTAALKALQAPQPVTVQVARGISLDITPHSLAEVSAAELDLNLTVSEPSPPKVVQGSTNDHLLDRIAKAQLKTRVRVPGVRLFEVSNFALDVQAPRPDGIFPIVGHAWNLNYAQIRRSHRRWSWGGSGSRINSVI